MSDFLYCLNTSTIRPTPLLRKIEVAAQAGYRAIEPWNDEIDAYLASGGTLAELRRALDDAGLRVVNMIALSGWTDQDAAAYTKALDECRRRMDQAAELSCPVIVASPPQEVVDLRFASDRFGELLELGEERGVTPAMEFLGFVDGINTTAAAWAVASGADDSRARIVSDVFHILRGGSTLDDLLSIPGDRLAIFHINDLPADPPFTQQTDYDRVMIGEGLADLSTVMSHLRAIAYKGPLSLELFNRRLWQEDPLTVARLGLERIRGLVDSR